MAESAAGNSGFAWKQKVRYPRPAGHSLSWHGIYWRIWVYVGSEHRCSFSRGLSMRYKEPGITTPRPKPLRVGGWAVSDATNGAPGIATNGAIATLRTAIRSPRHGCCCPTIRRTPRSGRRFQCCDRLPKRAILVLPRPSGNSSPHQAQDIHLGHGLPSDFFHVLLVEMPDEFFHQVQSSFPGRRSTLYCCERPNGNRKQKLIHWAPNLRLI